MSTYGRAAYSLGQKFWHWFMAALLIAAFALGLYMEDLDFSPGKLELIQYHKWLGVSVLGFAFVRLFHRLLRKPMPLSPATLEGMPKWQQLAHSGNIFLMYVLFFGIPLSGWLMSNSAGYPVDWLGMKLPALVGKNESLNSIVSEVHEIAAFTLAGLVGLHILALLKHQFMDKDDVLKRMM